jgi:hypothetical protein
MTSRSLSEKVVLCGAGAAAVAIDSVTRVRWLSLRLAETLTFDDSDCAVFVWLLDG